LLGAAANRHAEDVTIEPRPLVPTEKIVDVVAGVDAHVSHHNDTARIVVAAHFTYDWAKRLLVHCVSWEKIEMKGYAVCIHSQPHLDNRIWPAVFLKPKPAEPILMIDFEVEVGDIIVDGLGVAAVLFFDLSVHMPLAFLGDLWEVGQCSIDIRLGEVKPLEVPVLLLKCFSLGAWREQPGDDQKSHDGIGVELEILVTGLVSKEPV